MADAITEYRHQMARAKRNVAICVVELQSDVLVPNIWRDKADRLRNAVSRAERLARCNNFHAAVLLLSGENEPA